jgi:hypothetical protein
MGADGGDCPLRQRIDRLWSAQVQLENGANPHLADRRRDSPRGGLIKVGPENLHLLSDCWPISPIRSSGFYPAPLRAHAEGAVDPELGMMKLDEDLAQRQAHAPSLRIRATDRYRPSRRA